MALHRKLDKAATGGILGCLVQRVIAWSIGLVGYIIYTRMKKSLPPEAVAEPSRSRFRPRERRPSLLVGGNSSAKPASVRRSSSIPPFATCQKLASSSFTARFVNSSGSASRSYSSSISPRLSSGCTCTSRRGSRCTTARCCAPPFLLLQDSRHVRSVVVPRVLVQHGCGHSALSGSVSSGVNVAAVHCPRQLDPGELEERHDQVRGVDRMRADFAGRKRLGHG